MIIEGSSPVFETTEAAATNDVAHLDLNQVKDELVLSFDGAENKEALALAQEVQATVEVWFYQEKLGEEFQSALQSVSNEAQMQKLLTEYQRQQPELHSQAQTAVAAVLEKLQQLLESDQEEIDVQEIIRQVIEKDN